MQTVIISAGLALSVAFSSLAAISATPADDPALIREQKTVIVDGKPEQWSLRWEAKPTLMCGEDDPVSSTTCPCSGFAFGEQGPLALIRRRSDGVTERLELGPLFEANTPIMGAGGGQAVLQRRAPVYEEPDDDLKHVDDNDFAARVAQRPESDVMQFADFNHDGQATEFLFQVATAPCGKHQMVLIGISEANPHLHVFSSAEKPNEPLILGSWEWEALRDSSAPVDVIDWNCEDHGSDLRWTVHLSANAGVIHATKDSRQCPDPTKSEAYQQILKLNDMYKRRQIPYDEFIKRKQELIKQLPSSPQ